MSWNADLASPSVALIRSRAIDGFSRPEIRPLQWGAAPREETSRRLAGSGTRARRGGCHPSSRSSFRPRNMMNRSQPLLTLNLFHSNDKSAQAPQAAPFGEQSRHLTGAAGLAPQRSAPSAGLIFPPHLAPLPRLPSAPVTLTTFGSGRSSWLQDLFLTALSQPSVMDAAEEHVTHHEERTEHPDQGLE